MKQLLIYLDVASAPHVRVLYRTALHVNGDPPLGVEGEEGGGGRGGGRRGVGEVGYSCYICTFYYAPAHILDNPPRTVRAGPRAGSLLLTPFCAAIS